MIKICTQCNGLGYTEEKKVYPIFFLPDVGYAKVVRKICEVCNNGTEARRQKSERQFKKGNTKARANGLDEGRAAKN